MLLESFGYFALQMAIIGAVCWGFGVSGLMDRWFGDKWKALSVEIPWPVMVGIAVVAGATEYLIQGVLHPPLVDASAWQVRAFAFRFAMARFSGIAVFGILGGFAFRKIGLAAVGQIVGAVLGLGGLGYNLASLLFPTG